MTASVQPGSSNPPAGTLRRRGVLRRRLVLAAAGWLAALVLALVLHALVGDFPVIDLACAIIAGAWTVVALSNGEGSGNGDA